MKAVAEKYFHVVLLIMLYKVVLAFESVDETLVCDHSNESYLFLTILRKEILDFSVSFELSTLVSERVNCFFVSNTVNLTPQMPRRGRYFDSQVSKTLFATKHFNIYFGECIWKARTKRKTNFSGFFLRSLFSFSPQRRGK